MEVPPGVLESDSRVPTSIGAISFVLTVAFIAVALRTYTRFFLLKQPGIDDWAAVFTFLLVFSSGFAAVWNVRNGLGRHVYFLSAEQIKEYMKTFFTSLILYNVSLGGIKMTFLLQYHRVLGVSRMKKVFVGAMLLVGVWTLSQFLVMFFSCSPIAAFWDKSIPGTCMPNFPLWYINAAGNIATDVLIFVLPLPVIGSLKLGSGQKYVLLGIFGLGFFTCAISIIRIRFLQLEEDFTWTNVEGSAWSVGELSSGLTCACLPACRPLVARFIPALSSRATKSSTYHSHPSHANYAKKRGQKSQHRDPELGGSVKKSLGLTPNVHRHLESADSKTGIYRMDDYTPSEEDYRHEGDLPIHVHEALKHRSSKMERMSRPHWRQESVDKVDFESRDDAVVETRIESRLGIPDKARLQSQKSIKVTRAIVQVSSQRVDE
ncbi:hypothetical protein LY78DRAFT_577598 [Colletotrichum sublineola]|nr:hypothetical protein LY78DRAFT_577598 [Colletotrichum sublineola]